MTSADLAALKALITAHEGRRTYLYDDKTGLRIAKGTTVIGHPTWGIGCNTDTTPFCDAAIDAQFDFLLTALQAGLSASLPWTDTLPAVQVRVLLDIAYNAGLHGLLGFTKMLAALERGDAMAAALEVVNSTLAPARAERLARLLRS